MITYASISLIIMATTKPYDMIQIYRAFFGIWCYIELNIDLYDTIWRLAICFHPKLGQHPLYLESKTRSIF